ncbi:MAG: hypothetical protein EAZ97_00720 [Bacteroidetes bacterium]|nr:MAG: hypothetical protein EAZ97_00720 [Bacteroidota bacterium]
MKTLHTDWLTDGLIDFEYKKYLLLAYLKNIRQDFDEKKLYPSLSDLIFHYQNLLEIKENKKLIYEQFPKVISQADFNKLEISYKKIVEDDEVMREIEEIVQYALPRFQGLLNNGKEIYEFIENNLEIATVGITPIYKNEGYMFISEHLVQETKIYQYQISVFESAKERFRGVHTQYLESVQKSLGQTYENLKISLTRKYTNMPNPATFLIVSKVVCPFDESLLPIAKRALVKHLSLAS